MQALEIYMSFHNALMVVHIKQREKTQRIKKKKKKKEEERKKERKKEERKKEEE
jgi:hypothetical protein